MRKLLIDDILFEDMNAGSKARRDIIRFLDNYKGEYIKKNSSRYNYIYILKYFTISSKLKNQDIVICNYPLYTKSIVNNRIYKEIPKKSIAIIHDLQSLRKAATDNIEVKEEIEILNRFGCVISHNEIMTRWLVENGLKSKIVNLELFDYYGESTDCVDRIYGEKKEVIFAGNLDVKKSGFLYKINNLFFNNIVFKLYGSGLFEENYHGNKLQYCGSFKADILPNYISGDYGLVWDGTSIETCIGNSGEYMKYNNPHKLSLYIASQLPVIVWSKAAISEVVKKYNIGIVIDSLEDIQRSIDGITKEQYAEFKNNILCLSNKVKEGYFVKRAVKSAEGIL